MERRILFFVGSYPDVRSAEGDFEALRILHSCDDIGAYDAAVLTTRSDGTLAVHKDERRSSRAAWIGAAAGAGADAWPPPLPGLTETDAHEIRDVVREGHAALIVMAGVEDTRKIEQTAVEATRSSLKHLDADFDAAERESR